MGNRLSKIYTKTGDDGGHDLMSPGARPVRPAPHATKIVVFVACPQAPAGACAPASLPASSCFGHRT
ncbi:hypothetical protein [Luteimonas aquatica]|uniref:hypothetical protein n=1 Tax=Luteimonas aquatica TaxID=450364 RepID=UPI001F5ABE07|nr:hypothetical protein [Luteimonas aquatica]